MALNGFHGDHQVMEHLNGDDVSTEDYVHHEEEDKTVSEEETNLVKKLNDELISDVTDGGWCSTNNDDVSNNVEVISTDNETQQPTPSSEECTSDVISTDVINEAQETITSSEEFIDDVISTNVISSDNEVQQITPSSEECTSDVISTDVINEAQQTTTSSEEFIDDVISTNVINSDNETQQITPSSEECTSDVISTDVINEAQETITSSEEFIDDVISTNVISSDNEVQQITPSSEECTSDVISTDVINEAQQTTTSSEEFIDDVISTNVINSDNETQQITPSSEECTSDVISTDVIKEAQQTTTSSEEFIDDVISTNVINSDNETQQHITSSEECTSDLLISTTLPTSPDSEGIYVSDEQLISSSPNSDVTSGNDVTNSEELTRDFGIEPEMSQVDAVNIDPEVTGEDTTIEQPTQVNDNVEISSTAFEDSNIDNKVDQALAEDLEPMTLIEDIGDQTLEEHVLPSSIDDCLNTQQSPLFEVESEHDKVACTGSKSTAVTPKDEFRHLLCREEDTAEVEHQVVDTEQFNTSATVAEENHAAETQSDVTMVTSSNEYAAVVPCSNNDFSTYDVISSSVTTGHDDVSGEVPLSSNNDDQATVAATLVDADEPLPQTSSSVVMTTSPSPARDEACQRFPTRVDESFCHVTKDQKELKQVRPLSLNLRSDETNTSPVSSSATSPHRDLDCSPSAVVVNRQPVEKVAPPEITKTVLRMFESGEIADRHQVPRRTTRIDDEIASESSGVYENQPVPVDNDVIRDNGEYISPRSEVQEGLTKSLLTQWQAKGSEEFRSPRRPIIVAEAEGVVLESQPSPQRPDVVREDCRENATELPTPGYARLLRERFTGQDQQTSPKKDAKAAVLAEVAAAAESGTPSVVENVPNRRPDVVREDDTVEEVWMRKGYTRDLTGFWSAPQQSQGCSPKAPIELPRGENGCSVYENSPRTLDETVVRGGDCLEEQIAIEKGRAKTMVGMWQNRAGDTPVKPRSEPISLEKEVDGQGAGVYENEPTQRQGVVRSGDQVEEVMGKQGQIRNMAGRFAGTPQCNGVGRGPVPDMVVIDRADGPTVLENHPTQLNPDVIRSLTSTGSEQANVEPGSTRNLVASWKNKELENSSPQVSRQLELDLARDAGVYENQPEVRTDVVRADYDEPEMIPVAQMRSTRALWNQKELDEQAQADKGPRSNKKSPPEPVRFTPPRERTPPRVVQEDFRSFQSLTLSSSKSSTPGGLSPSTQRQQHEPLSDPVSMTSSTVHVFK